MAATMSQRRASRPALRRLARTARKIGVPQAQLQQFLRTGYVPQPKQMVFHAAARACDQANGPDQLLFGGARGPGKSHAIFAQVGLDDCQRYPGLKVLYLRKVGKQAREQMEDLRRKVFGALPHKFNRNSGLIEFTNGSRIFVGHFRHESDVDNYLGLEYDIIAIEELTSLSESKYKTLRDSNRTSLPLRPRLYASTNPGNVGHGWVKRRFVEPARTGEETYTRFIPATVDDNAFVDAGYRRKLEENTGWKLRAYRFGDWDIAAGAFFTTFRHDVHVVEPFPIPLDWRVWLSMDYGFTHPTVAGLFAQDGDANTYLVDSHSQSRWLVPQQADAMRAMLRRNNVEAWRLDTKVAGSDLFAQRGTGPTLSEQYLHEGFDFQRAQMDRVAGAAQLLKLLGDPEAGGAAQVLPLRGAQPGGD